MTKSRTIPESGPEDTRMTQRVQSTMKNRFIARRKTRTPLNRTFGAGVQLAAAMMLWDELTDKIRLKWCLWAQELEPYDPALGETMRRAMEQVLQPGGDK